MSLDLRVGSGGGELVGVVESYEDIYRFCDVSSRRGSSCSWRSGSAVDAGEEASA